MFNTVFKTKIITLVLFLSLPSFTFKSCAEEVEIGGLLLNNTISRLGHDFAYKFGQLWQDIPNKQGLNLHIKEQVVPRAGTRLTITLNNQLIYVTYLGRRQSSLQARVEQAIYIVINAMAQSEQYQNNPDIAHNGW
jgi:curli production assembly/transport component CsgE